MLCLHAVAVLCTNKCTYVLLLLRFVQYYVGQRQYNSCTAAYEMQQP